jgi:hypothetical protein
MSDPITAPALAEHPRDDSKEAKLAAFARLMLHAPADIKKFIGNQEALTRPSRHRAD